MRLAPWLRRGSAVAAALLTLTPAAAAQDVVPDGRADASGGVESQPDGAIVRGQGNVGAFGFDHDVEAGSSGFRVTNPPMYGAAGTRGGEYEETFGPRVANATVGTGGMTAGLDAHGRLTNLGWPGPGLWEHVNYVATSRGAPDMGAPENAGSFGGTRQGWLLPRFGWRVVRQAYASDTTETLETVLVNDDLALEVTVTDVVDPVEDLVARRFAFSATPPGFAYYANMNPTTSRVPRTPSVHDGLLDNVSDFGTVYDAATSASIHFRPYTADAAALSTVATSQPSAGAALAAVAGAFGPGVYVAVGGQARALEHQAGLESGGLLRSEAEASPAVDPFYDLLHDGALSGSDAAFGKTAGALALEPDDPADPKTYTVYLSAAANPAEALATLRRARERGFESIRRSSDEWWREWIARARLPATEDAETIAVARHALMLIKTAQDRRTGAIVANATTQTPYRQDWVRDGAFFNYALLLAGYDEMALAHADFYRRVYRPGGTWDSFYYTDGAEAGFAYPYEIDSQAFALWALWLPYELGAGDNDYLGGVYPAIRDTADALLLCRDPSNELQCRAPEDDAFVPTQGPQGASTVYLALRAAVAAAEALGLDESRRAAWSDRAEALRTAALARLCTRGECGAGRGGVYMAWPSRLLDGTDVLQSHLAPHAARLDERASGAQPPDGGSFQYPMEALLALAPLWTGPDRDAKLDAWVRWLTHDVAEPGVLHYGERIFRCSGSPCAPGREYLHTIGFPHIWSGAEMYIAAAFVYGVTGCAAPARVGEAACRD